MATLYVENVPDELYNALRQRARKNRKSIAAEVLSLLEDYVPTSSELRRRQRVFRELKKMRSEQPLTRGPFPSTQEMLRGDRDR